MADAQTTPFVMHGARAAVDAGMYHISEQVEGIERAVSENTGLAFDLAKTLIESTCHAIVGFLHRVHKQDIESPKKTQLSYYDNIEFNEYVDELHERVHIFAEEFEPSRILFELAPEPYRLSLAEYQQDQDVIDGKEERLESEGTS